MKQSNNYMLGLFFLVLLVSHEGITLANEIRNGVKMQQQLHLRTNTQMQTKQNLLSETEQKTKGVGVIFFISLLAYKPFLSIFDFLILYNFT